MSEKGNIVERLRAKHADEIASLRAQLASARKALEPFSHIATDVIANHPGWAHSAFHSDWTEYRLRFADFDEARLALTDENRKVEP